MSNKTPCGWKLIASGSWLAGQEFTLYKEGTILGRGKDCDITIPGTHLSRNHAELSLQNGKLLVRDLESSNGTFINGEEVKEKEAASGDTIRLDVYSFKIVGPQADGGAATAPRVAVKHPLNENAHKSLENIRTLKQQEKDYSDTQWVTKPTSVGNRTHNVPGHSSGLDWHFWVALGVGLALIGGLIFYFVS